MANNIEKQLKEISERLEQGVKAVSYTHLFFMMVCVGIYAVLVANIQMSDNIHSALFGVKMCIRDSYG